MKRVVVTQFGGPEVLKMEECPIPEPGPSAVRVKVKAAGINYADIVRRRGLYPGGPAAPFPAGFEVSGIVDKVGEGVTRFKVGDEVAAFVDGGFSEYAVTNGRTIFKKPAGLSFHGASALPCQYLTAYHALITLAQLGEGQTVLIQAAAGGLGNMLVQIAKIRGATVLGTASTPEKLELLRELGCDHPIDYRRTDFREAVKEITDAKGCDLVIESVGGEVFERSLQCVNFRGRLVTLGNASRSEQNIDVGIVRSKSMSVSGLVLNHFLRDRTATEQALAELEPWVDSGRLRVITRHAFRLDQAAEAQQFIEDRKSVGKVSLLVD